MTPVEEANVRAAIERARVPVARPIPTTNAEDVAAFHRKFNLPKGPRPGPLIRSVGVEVATQRFSHLKEELEEYRKALIAQDTVGEADALVDLVYVALGSAVMMGIPWQACWDAVHGANMRKVQAGTSEKQGIVKPAGWEPPDLRSILEYVGADL